MTRLHDKFAPSLPIAEKILPPLVVYLFLIVALRLAGKREMAQFNPFDLVVLLTISNTVQNAIIGEDNSITGGLIGAATLLVVNHAVVRYLYGHERLEQLVEGAPSALIERGAIQRNTRREELVTELELETAAHNQGIARLAAVDRAVLDPGGTMSFVAKTPTTEVSRPDAIMARLNQLSAQAAALQS